MYTELGEYGKMKRRRGENQTWIDGSERHGFIVGSCLTTASLEFVEHDLKTLRFNEPERDYACYSSIQLNSGGCSMNKTHYLYATSFEAALFDDIGPASALEFLSVISTDKMFLKASTSHCVTLPFEKCKNTHQKQVSIPKGGLLLSTCLVHCFECGV